MVEKASAALCLTTSTRLYCYDQYGSARATQCVRYAGGGHGQRQLKTRLDRALPHRVDPVLNAKWTVRVLKEVPPNECARPRPSSLPQFAPNETRRPQRDSGDALYKDTSGGCLDHRSQPAS